MIALELYTRPGCHLCDVMKEALSQASTGLDVRLTETDVTSDPELEERFGSDVPVLYVNGKRAFQHRATVRELRRRLERG